MTCAWCGKTIASGAYTRVGFLFYHNGGGLGVKEPDCYSEWEKEPL